MSADSASRSLSGVFPKVVERGFADAVNRRRAALSQVDLVQIALEDRLFVVAGLHNERHRGFVELALETPLRREEEVLHELLSQRARPLPDLARSEIDQDGAEHPAQIDARVFEEALIFDGEDRVDQMAGDLGKTHQLPLLAVRSEIRPDGHRLQHEGADFAMVFEIADPLDLALRNADLNFARWFGTARVAEGPAKKDQTLRRPAEFSRLVDLSLGALTVRELGERLSQTGSGGIEAGVQHGWRRVDPRRHAEQAALEAGAHFAIERQQVTAGQESGRKTHGHDDEPRDAEGSDDARPSFRRLALRLLPASTVFATRHLTLARRDSQSRDGPPPPEHRPAARPPPRKTENAG